jgi:hypothetical protein
MKSGREMGDSETSDTITPLPARRRKGTRSSEDDSAVIVAMKRERQMRIFYPRKR